MMLMLVLITKRMWQVLSFLLFAILVSSSLCARPLQLWQTYLDWQAQPVGGVQEQFLGFFQHILDVFFLPGLHARCLPLMVRHKLQLLCGGTQPQQVVALTTHDMKPADFIGHRSCSTICIWRVCNCNQLEVTVSQFEVPIIQHIC